MDVVNESFGTTGAAIPHLRSWTVANVVHAQSSPPQPVALDLHEDANLCTADAEWSIDDELHDAVRNVGRCHPCSSSFPLLALIHLGQSSIGSKKSKAPV